MKRLRAIVLVAVVLVAGCADATSRNQLADWRLIPATEAADPRHLIVTVPLDDRANLARVADRLEADYPIELVAEWPLKAIGIHCFVFRVTTGTDVALLLQALNETAPVRAAQQVQEFRLMTGIYTDDHFNLQEALISINAPKAHRLSTGRNVRIAVVDTGVDVTHPDLAARVGETRDFVGVGSGPPPGELHGTAMAGVILADAANAKGIVGVAPEARLLALRGCWQENSAGRCSSFSLARALNFAVLNDVDIMNLSLAGPYDPLLAALIDKALARGIVVVAADSDGTPDGFPASMRGVIAAGTAISSVPAPGVDVITTAPGGGYDFASGSSIAAAHVSGVAALLLQRTPRLTPAQIRAGLMAGVKRQQDTGKPMLDACRALLSVLEETPADRC